MNNNSFKATNIMDNNTTNANLRKKLHQLTSKTYELDLPFILTTGKLLKIGMPYLYLEKLTGGNSIKAVRLIKIWQESDAVFLLIQDIVTLKKIVISFSLTYDGGYWLWSLADFEYLTNSDFEKQIN
jgi:hypothetical protein